MQFEINYMDNLEIADHDSNINYTSPSSELKEFDSSRKNQIASNIGSPNIYDQLEKEERNLQKVLKIILNNKFIFKRKMNRLLSLKKKKKRKFQTSKEIVN